MTVRRIYLAPVALAILALGAAGCADTQPQAAAPNPLEQRVVTLERQLAERDAQLQQAEARAMRAEQAAAEARAAAERAQQSFRSGLRK